MKSDTANFAEPPGRSWRTIRQEVSAPAMSRQGRRRQVTHWVKLGLLSLSLGLVGWAILTVVDSWNNDRAGLAAAVHSAPVRAIARHTDGVLTQEWVAGVLALPRPISLMALDLPALRDKLLAFGQVRGAVLTRNFPDTLLVTLQERSPVARVQASEGLGLTRQLLVAKDGVVYEGLNYSKALLASLPWLDGVRLVKTSGGYEPISGMADVSDLLTTAQLEAPLLYRGWLVVSLARLAEADEIIVKARDVPQIIFSRKRDYHKQVAQLDYVIDATQIFPEPSIQSVNLTLEGQVPVRLAGTPEELTAATRPEIPLHPPQRKLKRDL